MSATTFWGHSWQSIPQPVAQRRPGPWEQLRHQTHGRIGAGLAGVCRVEAVRAVCP